MSDLQTTLQTEAPAEPAIESRRDMLAAALDNIEAGTDENAAQRARDEAGRFASKQEPTDVVAKTIEPAPAPVVEKLTTWKKDYLPLQDKLEQGLPLTPEEAKKLSGYNLQREREYATGVSVWKEKATSRDAIAQAIEPFMPELQKNNISPDVWIGNLGRAHHTLALGSPQQKLEMFQKLARDYGIPLGAVQQSQQGALDPALMGLMEQISQLQGTVKDVSGKWEQQEQAEISKTISAFSGDKEKYPWFDEVRGEMAQILESGKAPDLEAAYRKAIRMDDDVWAKEQDRLSQVNQAQDKQRKVIQQAKAAATPRTVTPSGSAASASPKDRRALLTAAAEAMDGRV